MQHDTEVRGQKLVQPNNRFPYIIKLLLFDISLHIYFSLAPDPACSGGKEEQELLN